MIETSLHQSEPVALPGRPNGTVARSIARHALVTALMTVTAIFVFVPAALLHCGIRNGRRAAWICAAVALVPLAAWAAFSPADARTNGWVSLMFVAFAIVVPSLVVLPLVERGAKFGSVVVLMLLCSLGGLFATELLSQAALHHSPYAVQLAKNKEFYAKVVAEYRKNNAPASFVDAVRETGELSLVVLPAAFVTSLSFAFLLSLLMIGRLNAWRELAARRSGDDQALGVYLFRNFALPDWVLFAFVLGGLTPLASGLLQQLAANTLTVVVFLYIVQGLAIFRFLLAAMGGGLAQTMFGWLMLGFLTLLTAGLPVLLLGVAGLFDSFFDFRHSRKRKDDSHESHFD